MMTPRKKLYFILENYINKKYSTEYFCDQMYELFDLEVDSNELTKLEYDSFKGLSEVTSRFSPFDEDLKKYDCYYSEEQVMNKAKGVWKKLCKRNHCTI